MSLDLKKLEAEIDLFLENETEQSLNNLFKMTDNMKDKAIIDHCTEPEIRQLLEKFSTEELNDFIPKLLNYFGFTENEMTRAELKFAVSIMEKVINEREGCSMKEKVIINGVEYVPKVVIEPAKVGRWMPGDGEQYFWVDWDGVSRLSVNENLLFDEGMLKMGNVYQTKELVIRARDRQLLLVELQDYADQKNAWKELPKHCFFLIKDGNRWQWASSSTRNPGNIRFRNSEDADAAIAHFGDRLDLLL